MEALRGLGILAGPRRGQRPTPTPATGMAIKIEDGDGYDRGTWAATIEALRQAGVLDGAPAARARPLPPAGLARPARPGRGRGDPRVRARARRRADRLRPTTRGDRAASCADDRDARSVPNAGPDAGRQPGRDQARLPAAGQALPPRLGRRPALRRFLAIQAAYEALTDAAGPWPRLRGRAAATRPAPPPAAAVASRCVPRPGDRGRTGPGRAGRAASGGPAGPGSGPRPGGPPRPARAPRPTVPDRRVGPVRPTAGSDRSRWRRSRPWIDEHGSESERRNGRSTIAAKSRAEQGDDRLDELRRRPTRSRSIRPGRGRPGTGPASGTYWTLNPKEYADPRKHGPEYLARSRRGVGGAAVPGGRPRHPRPDPSPRDAR